MKLANLASDRRLRAQWNVDNGACFGYHLLRGVPPGGSARKSAEAIYGRADLHLLGKIPVRRGIAFWSYWEWEQHFFGRRLEPIPSN